MPIGDRLRRRPPERRRVREGESYSVDEDVELETPPPRPEPPVEVQGEPWGWTKGPPYPRGYREDGQYGPREGEDERRREGERR